MTVRLKTVCPEQIGALPNGDYSVPDGCSAAAALRSCMRAGGLEPLPAEREAQLLFLRNSQHVRPETPLSDGDRLTVLRPLAGG